MPITQPNKEIVMSFHLFKEKLTIIYITVQKLKKAEKKLGIDPKILEEINTELRLFKEDGYQNKCPYCGEIIEEIRLHLYNCDFFPKDFGFNCFNNSPYTQFWI